MVITAMQLRGRIDIEYVLLILVGHAGLAGHAGMIIIDVFI